MTVLDLSDMTLEEIAADLKSIDQYTSIIFENTHIQYQGLTLISQALEKNKSITFISIIGCTITPHKASVIAEILKISKYINSFTLTRCSFVRDITSARRITARETDKAVLEIIAEALKINQVITHINLSYNAIGYEGAIAIADALKVNQAITSIYFSGNKINDEGLTAIAEALKVNHFIQSIDFDENTNIRHNGVIAFSEVLKVNQGIRTVILPTESSLAAEEAMADALNYNYGITIMKLGLKCNWTEKNKKILSEAIKFSNLAQFEDMLDYSHRICLFTNLNHIQYLDLNIHQREKIHIFFSSQSLRFLSNKHNFDKYTLFHIGSYLSTSEIKTFNIATALGYFHGKEVNITTDVYEGLSTFEAIVRVNHLHSSFYNPNIVNFIAKTLNNNIRFEDIINTLNRNLEIYEIIKLLSRENEASLNSMVKYKNIALMLLEEFGYLYDEMFSLIVNAPHGINIVNNHGDTALMLAARFGRDDVVSLLLKNNADSHIVNNDGETASIIAIRKEYFLIAELLNGESRYYSEPITSKPLNINVSEDQDPTEQAGSSFHSKKLVGTESAAAVEEQVHPYFRDDLYFQTETIFRDSNLNIPEIRTLLLRAASESKDKIDRLFNLLQDNEVTTALIDAVKEIGSKETLRILFEPINSKASSNLLLDQVARVSTDPENIASSSIYEDLVNGVLKNIPIANMVIDSAYTTYIPTTDNIIKSLFSISYTIAGCRGDFYFSSILGYMNSVYSFSKGNYIEAGLNGIVSRLLPQLMTKASIDQNQFLKIAFVCFSALVFSNKVLNIASEYASGQLTEQHNAQYEYIHDVISYYYTEFFVKNNHYCENPIAGVAEPCGQDLTILIPAYM